VHASGYPDIINIPRQISEDRALVSFGVKGGSFSFVLSSYKNISTKGQKFADGKPINSYIFSVDTIGGKGVFCNKAGSTEVMMLNPRFNDGIDDDDEAYIEYEVVLHYDTGLIGISHGSHGDKTNSERALMKVSDLTEMKSLDTFHSVFF